MFKTVRVNLRQSSSGAALFISRRKISNQANARRGFYSMTAAIKKTCLTAIIILALAALAFAQPQLPAFTARVNDFAGKLSDAKRQQLESLLENFRTRSGIEVAVVTMQYDDLQGYALEDYSVQLAHKWGLGSDSQKR